MRGAVVEIGMIEAEAGAIQSTQAIYQLALAKVPGIGIAQTKKLIRVFGDAAGIFSAPGHALREAGLPAEKADAIAGFDAHRKMKAELKMLGERGIRTLFITDADYPRRYLNLPGAPPLLYYKGRADLNANKIVGIIGTRSPDDYGRVIAARIVRQLAQPGLVVISGLAMGIDGVSHKAALENGLPTVGILGSGIDNIYPTEHKGLAEKMTVNGGLLTEYGCGVKAERYYFPRRNRLVAGLCDALVVVQTALDGGSMVTVNHAREYGKKIFAVPGQITEHQSQGCNWLIRQGIAQLLSSGEQLTADMGWGWPEGGTGSQASLSFGSGRDDPAGGGRGGGGTGREDTRNEERLLTLIVQRDRPGIDELVVCSGLDASAVALGLLNLELRGSIVALPGKRYMANTG